MAPNQYSFSDVRGQHGNNPTINRSAWVNTESYSEETTFKESEQTRPMEKYWADFTLSVYAVLFFEEPLSKYFFSLNHLHNQFIIWKISFTSLFMDLFPIPTIFPGIIGNKIYKTHWTIQLNLKSCTKKKSGGKKKLCGLEELRKIYGDEPKGINLSIHLLINHPTNQWTGLSIIQR